MDARSLELLARLDELRINRWNAQRGGVYSLVDDLKIRGLVEHLRSIGVPDCEIYRNGFGRRPRVVLIDEISRSFNFMVAETPEEVEQAVQELRQQWEACSYLSRRDVVTLNGLLDELVGDRVRKELSCDNRVKYRADQREE